LAEHDLSVLAGFDIREAKTASQQSLSYGFDPAVLTAGKVDYVNAYPNFITGSTQAIRDGSSYSAGNNRFVSWYGNMGYQYKMRYLVNASVRKDASNLFGVNSNEKGVPLWSGGLGWIISQEPFFKKGWVNYLKVRLTYGVAGNVDQSKSAYTVLSFFSAATSTNLPYARVEQFANPSLRWEKMYTTNLGVDFDMWKRRLFGSVEFYIKNGKDLFGSAPLDATAGLQREALTANAASIKGKGVDVNIHTVNITGSLGWTSNLLFSYNSSYVSEYYLNTVLLGRNMVNAGFNLSPREGEKLYRVSSYAWVGLDPQTGAPRGIIDGKPSMDYTNIRGTGTKPEDIVTDGSAIPEFYGSVINCLQWKNLVLTINVTYKMGYAYRRSVLLYTSLYSGGPGHEEYYQRWKQPGDELITNVPSMIYPANSLRDDFYQNSAITVVKGDHIRLQFIDLQYQPFSGSKKKMLHSVRLKANAANLGVIWKADKSRFDPDYPVQKLRPQFTCGVSVAF
jgi:hypothetical protein